MNWEETIIRNRRKYWEWVDGDGYNKTQDWDIKSLLKDQVKHTGDIAFKTGQESRLNDPKLREKIDSELTRIMLSLSLFSERRARAKAQIISLIGDVWEEALGRGEGEDNGVER